MAQQRRHQSRRRRRGRFSGLYRLLSVLAVAAAIAVACVVFFRVNEVTVVGNSRYTAEEIIAASGIKTGDNLIALSQSRVAGAIRTQLPYVETVTVRRQPPDGVLLTVKERVAAASIEGNGGRWLISSQGKVLEQAAGQPVIAITGLNAVAPYAGATVQVAEEDETTLSHVLSLLGALEEAEMLSQCTGLDCTSSACVTLTWDIYQIKFPRGGDYAHMLVMLRAAMDSEEMPKDEPGIFDFTVKDGELYFRRSR